MPPFSERTQTKKGMVGEGVFDRFIRSQGNIPYRPTEDDLAHPFDRLVAGRDKKTIFIADAKAKAARERYPDTGIDMRHWLVYRLIWIHHRLDTLLGFVDEKAGRLYGSFLSDLETKRIVRVGSRTLIYPLTQWGASGEIRYFPLCAMREMGRLTDEEVETLKRLSTRNPKYDQSGYEQGTFL